MAQTDGTSYAGHLTGVMTLRWSTNDSGGVIAATNYSNDLTMPKTRIAVIGSKTPVIAHHAHEYNLSMTVPLIDGANGVTNNGIEFLNMAVKNVLFDMNLSRRTADGRISIHNLGSGSCAIENIRIYDFGPKSVPTMDVKALFTRLTYAPEV